MNSRAIYVARGYNEVDSAYCGSVRLICSMPFMVCDVIGSSECGDDYKHTQPQPHKKHIFSADA